jgi:diketogulonate reductase-like aldo/keto reductase
MPWLGLGTYQLEEAGPVENAVRWALEAGYRAFDTASYYDNETGVGRAIRDSDIPRESVFVTTKLWKDEQGYDAALSALDRSLHRLEMDYVDLYMIHWPASDKSRATWRALEEIYDSGRARAIGVSNFLIHHLEDLMADARVMPMVNQVEFHPHLQQPGLYAFCFEHDIRLEAWRPLMRGGVLEIPQLVELGKRYGKSPAQVTIRWMLERGVVTIPRSSREEHIRENAQVFDFHLEPEDVALINSLDRGVRLGDHPGEFRLVG